MEDFISFKELEDIFPEVTTAQWKELAAGIGYYPVLRRIYDTHLNPLNKRQWGFVDLDLDAFEDAYKAFIEENKSIVKQNSDRDSSFAIYGAIPVNQLITSLRIGKLKLYHLLDQLDIEPGDYIFGNNQEGKGLDKKQYAQIRPYLKQHKKMLLPKSVKSIRRWSEITGASETDLKNKANELHIAARYYSFHGNVSQGLTRKQAELIFAAYPDLGVAKNIPPAAQTDMSLSNIARQVGMSLPVLTKLVNGAEIIPVLRKYPNKKVGQTLTKQQRSALCLAYLPFTDLFNNPEIKIQYLSKWANDFSMNVDTLRKLVYGTSVIPLRTETDNRVTELLTQAQIDLINKIYEPFKEVKPVSLDTYARQNKTQVSVIAELARAAGIEPQYYLFRNKRALGLLPHEIEKLEETYKPFIVPEDPLDAIITLQTYAKERNISVASIKTRLRKAEVEPMLRPNPNGARSALSITGREALTLERAFPDLVLKR